MGDPFEITDQMLFELKEIKKRRPNPDRGKILKQINAIATLRLDNEDLHRDLLEEKQKVAELSFELKIAKNRIAVLEDWNLDWNLD